MINICRPSTYAAEFRLGVWLFGGDFLGILCDHRVGIVLRQEEDQLVHWSVQQRRGPDPLALAIERFIRHQDLTYFLTRPSSLGWTCTTLARGHRPRGPSLSLEMTTSPIFRSFLGCTHFWRNCRDCRYSLRHLSQNSLAKYWTLLHHFLQYRSGRWNLPGGGRVTFGFMVRRWLGVSGSGASGLPRFSVVRGLELMIHSASVMKVLKASSSSCVPALMRDVSNARRTVPISLSQAPPIWLAWGTFILKGNHSHWFLSRYFCTLSWSISTRDPFISFRAPTKFVPMSQRICLTGPRRLRNRRSALMKEDVVWEFAVSRCTLLDPMHVNSTP